MGYESIHNDLRKRIIILAALVVVAAAVLILRLGHLTLWQGSRLARAAEERLDAEALLPTWRGSILDRTGRVLAEDVASYDIAVSYPLAGGKWASERAQEQAKREAGSAWRKMDVSRRAEAVDALLPEWKRRERSLMKLLASRSGLAESELRERLGAIAARIDRQREAVHARAIELRRQRGQSLDVAPEPIREMREMHVVARDIPATTAFELRKVGDANPGSLEVLDAARRRTPWDTAEVEVARDHLPRAIRTSVPLVMRLDGALDAIVGSVRHEAWKEDLERRPFERVGDSGSVEVDLGGYRAGSEVVGSRGLERRFEDRLRGLRGRVTRRLATEEEERLEPVPGAHVQSSIDAALQLRVQAALDPRTGLTLVQPWHTSSDALVIGDALPAAAVVLEIATGEILAAATTPRAGDAARGGRVPVSMDTAGIHRAFEAKYPPGSLVKPLVYLAAVAEGVAAEDEAIECNGHYFKERSDAARCWIYRDRYKFTTHTKSIGGPLGIEQAMARSCNIYFYTLADRLGAERLCDWYRRFGLGRLGGDVPSAAVAKALEGRGDRFATVSLGIGQGAMAVTPLEMAAAYAMVARGGSWIEPTWHKGGGRVAAVQPFSSTAVSRVLRGLEQVTSESYGTGSHMDHGGGVREPIIEAPGARWWIKTGTAEAPPLRLDRDGDGVAEKSVTDADHAWCAGVVGSAIDGMPRYAIAVIVEHGGGGGRTAGPVMAAVIRALVEEGYVGAARSPGPTRVEVR